MRQEDARARVAELNELYQLVTKYPGIVSKLEKGDRARLAQLLSRHTQWEKLGKSQKAAFSTALSFGAILDETGKLIINDPQARRLVSYAKATKFLPPELISPKTQDPLVIFRKKSNEIY